MAPGVPVYLLETVTSPPICTFCSSLFESVQFLVATLKFSVYVVVIPLLVISYVHEYLSGLLSFTVLLDVTVIVLVFVSPVDHLIFLTSLTSFESVSVTVWFGHSVTSGWSMVSVSVQFFSSILKLSSSVVSSPLFLFRNRFHLVRSHFLLGLLCSL